MSRLDLEGRSDLEGGRHADDAADLQALEAAIAAVADMRAELDDLALQLTEYRTTLAPYDDTTSERATPAIEVFPPEFVRPPAIILPELFIELESQLRKRLHKTASVSVYIAGEELLSYQSSIDGSGALAEPAPLFRAFSAGKAMVAATIWRLLDAGALEIDAPIAEYWPEFAQRGKTNVTLRHVLTHTSGLPHEYGRGDVDWNDWGRMCDILASMPTEYEPGKVIHYHAITFGLLLAETASRATGTPFVDLFEREVAVPLKLFDTHFAVDYSDEATRSRVTPLHTANGYHNPAMPFNMDWLLDNQVMTPGGSCITTARDLARLYATVCSGGISRDGDAWLSPNAVANVYTTHASAYDIEAMKRSRIGQGVWLDDDQPNRTGAPIGSLTFAHGGMGTAIAWGDPDFNLSVAILTDVMQNEDINGKRLNRISAAIRKDLGMLVGEIATI